MPVFTNLQVITTNSLMRSTLTVSDLLKHGKTQGHRALALTDHYSLRGAIEFYEEAKKWDIKPILGLTLMLQGYIQNNMSYPLILLAKNNKGYESLIQLSTSYYFNEEHTVHLA